MTDTAQTTKKREPKGIFGWLLLPAFVTLVTPFTFTAVIFSNYFSKYQILFDAKNRFSVPTLTFIGVEFFVAITLIAGWFVALYFLATKSRHYPSTSSILVFVVFALSILNPSLTAAYYHQPFKSEAIPGIFVLFGISVIWLAYMEFSKRVKNTFVI